MKKFALDCCINDKVLLEQKSQLVLYTIGILNPFKIKKFSSGRKVPNQLNYNDLINLGKLNLQKKLGKGKYSLRTIDRIFRLYDVKYCSQTKKTHFKTLYFFDKSHEAFLKAYDLIKNEDVKISAFFNGILKSDISKKVAPYHIYCCLIHYNNIYGINCIKIKNYIEQILEEVSEIEKK